MSPSSSWGAGKYTTALFLAECEQIIREITDRYKGNSQLHPSAMAKDPDPVFFAIVTRFPLGTQGEMSEELSRVRVSKREDHEPRNRDQPREHGKS